MAIKQISVFLENTAGRLAEVTGLLGKYEINLRAITIADTADFGILRLIADNPDKALTTLEEHGFTAKATEVLGVEVSDKPGGLATVMEIFNTNGLNIEYLYATLERNIEHAVVIFKVDDVEKGLRIIEKEGLTAIDGF